MTIMRQGFVVIEYGGIGCNPSTQGGYGSQDNGELILTSGYGLGEVLLTLPR